MRPFTNKPALWNPIEMISYYINPAIAQAKLVQLMTQFHWPQLFTFSFYEDHQ